MQSTRVISGTLVALAIALAMSGCNRGSGGDQSAVQNKATAQREEPAEVQRVKKLIREREFDKALQELQTLEQSRPQDPNVFNLRGAIYVHRGDLANARKSFEQALSIDGTLMDAANNLAQLDLLERNPEAARKRFESILAKDKAHGGAMLGLAGIAAATGKEGEYVEWLHKAAQADPTALQPRMLLANHYLQKNQPRKALPVAQEAQRASPDNPQVLAALGAAQLATNEKDGALKTYDQLARLTPQDPSAHYKLATAYAAKQDVEGVKSSVEKALKLKPDYAEAEILLATAELGAGRHAAALESAHRLQRQNAKSPAGFVLEGDIFMAKKEYVAAAKAYERALEKRSNGLLVVRLHQALSASGGSRQADTKLVQWLNEHPGDTVVRSYFAGNLAQAKQSMQAAEQYQLILKTDPKSVVALNGLAVVYHQQNDPRAAATAQQAYELDSDNPYVMDTLGWILASGGNARGLELIGKAVQIDPLQPTFRYHLAAALAKSGDKAKARAELEKLAAEKANFPERGEANALLRQLRE